MSIARQLPNVLWSQSLPVLAVRNFCRCCHNYRNCHNCHSCVVITINTCFFPWQTSVAAFKLITVVTLCYGRNLRLFSWWETSVAAVTTLAISTTLTILLWLQSLCDKPQEFPPFPSLRQLLVQKSRIKETKNLSACVVICTNIDTKKFKQEKKCHMSLVACHMSHVAVHL